MLPLHSSPPPPPHAVTHVMGLVVMPICMKLPTHLSALAVLWGVAATFRTDQCQCKIFSDPYIQNAIATVNMLATPLTPWIHVTTNSAALAVDQLHQCR